MRVIFATLALCASPAFAVDRPPLGDYPVELEMPPEPSLLRQYKMQQMLLDEKVDEQLDSLGVTSCVAGEAAGYACSNVDLASFLPLADIGGGSGNDIWGWTDRSNGNEYALMGRSTGTSFVDITDPENPVYLGDLPTHTDSSVWRDIKVFADHAFIVSEARNHGMQVFDLRQLRCVTSPPVTFVATANYERFGSSHNLVINEESGTAYAVGTKTCIGGLHMVDINVPTSPTFAGCHALDGYTHDAQCVTYHGPDAVYDEREICFAFNEDTVTITDVTDKSAPLQISRTGYNQSGYTHQGWLSDDHRLLFMDDELDERRFGGRTRTYIFDVSDLARPKLIDIHRSATSVIDHNMYTDRGLLFQSNYTSGMRILDLADAGAGVLTEVGFFDIYKDGDPTSFNGAWSVYPYYPSGVVVVSGIEQGLYVLRPNIPGLRQATAAKRIASANAGLPTTVGNELRLYRDGDDAILHVATLPPGGGGYNVYRGDAPTAAGTLLNPPRTTATNGHIDASSVRTASDHYYQIRAIDACGIEGP